MNKHINPARKKEYIYFIKATGASALQREAPLPPENADWAFLEELARYHGCLSLFFNSVKNLPANLLPPEEIYSKMQDTVNVLFVQDANQSYELRRVFDEFEKSGVYFLPMKGYVIKQDYPQSDYRLMADADVLFKEEQIDRVREIYENSGFKFDFFDKDNQYHFEKKPFIIIEMHTSLVNHRDEMFDYYQNVWEKARPKDGCTYEYEMTAEDYYIFMLEHASNHFKGGGIGIKHLIDIYIFNRKHNLDRNYLDRELKTIGLFTFENKMRTIAVKWFEKQDFDSFSLLEESVLLSANLGRRELAYAETSLNHKRASESKNKKSSRAAFVLSSIFPGRSTMSIHYTYLDKLPFLLPVSWAQFWFKRLFIEKNVSFKSGMKNRLNYISPEDEEYINALLEETGLMQK